MLKDLQAGKIEKLLPWTPSFDAALKANKRVNPKITRAESLKLFEHYKRSLAVDVQRMKKMIESQGEKPQSLKFAKMVHCKNIRRNDWKACEGDLSNLDRFDLWFKLTFTGKKRSFEIVCRAGLGMGRRTIGGRIYLRHLSDTESDRLKRWWLNADDDAKEDAWAIDIIVHGGVSKDELEVVFRDMAPYPRFGVYAYDSFRGKTIEVRYDAKKVATQVTIRKAAKSKGRSIGGSRH